MQFENGFEVSAPVDKVWDAVLDVERVAPTVPGAQVLERTGDNAYKVGIKIKLGPMNMQYRGDVEIVEADEKAHRAVMRAKAKEARGQGTASADVTMELSGGEDQTTGRIVTDMQVSGKAASMGRGVMQDVAGRMVDTFAKNLAAMLEGGEAPAEEAAAKPGAPEGQEQPAEAAAGTRRAAPKKAAAGNGAPSKPAGAQEATARAADAVREKAEAPPPPAGEDALDIGALAGPVLLERLRDPRVIGVLLLLAFLLGRRSARG